MNYKNKWALVTGAGRPGRVGAYLAEHMASQGANVYIHYRSSKEDAEKVKSSVEKAGREYNVSVELVHGDLAHRHDVERIFSGISPDIVINNAAVFTPANASPDMNLVEYLAEHERVLDENLNANLKSVKLVTEAAVYKMRKEKKPGLIVFIGDSFMERGVYNAGLAAYTSSKAYVTYAIRHYANAHGKDHIRFVGILNGPIEPPATASQEAIDGIREEINLPGHLLNPWIGPKAVAQAIDGFVSNDSMNGTWVEVNGGRAWGTESEHR